MTSATNVWFCLLLLSAQFAIEQAEGTIIWTQCPTNCSCIVNAAGTNLAVDCRGRTDVDHLPQQLDSLLLSSNVTHDRLTTLSIVNSPLMHIPGSVCQLTTLMHLNLTNNRLIQLPENCFTNFSNLVWFSATRNAIETLQDGVFNGLRKLRYLDLSRNRIHYIGLSVFATSSNLSSLFTILLSDNNLTSLEPWFRDRGLVGKFSRRVMIDLRNNEISKFTNKMGHSEICDDEIPYAMIHLYGNNIHHYMDVWNGWQLRISDVLSCYSIRNGTVNLLIAIDGRNIPCDCVDYQFFNAPEFLRCYWTTKELGAPDCILTDPVTKKSKLVLGFNYLNLFVCELTERCPVPCICAYRPHNATVHVYCSNTNLSVLPSELPELPDSATKYQLDFSNNQFLRRLGHHAYFSNTSILDVSNSGIADISDAWEEIAKIPDINLFGNKITSLPPSFFSVNITAKKLNFANNPWDCSCKNKQMSGWFNSVKSRLREKVLCHSPSRLRGKNIVQISNAEFCVDPTAEAVKRVLIITMSTVSGVVVVLLSVVFIVYRLRVKLYTRWKFHPFDRDECLGEDMDYDVFLSCSSDDNLSHGNGIRKQLEQRGYRVCYPPRDFLAGAPISDNICNAVVRSKRTVCLLTEHFLRRFKPLFIVHSSQ